MKQHNTKFAEIKKRGYEKGQKAVYKEIIKSVNYNPGVGRLIYCDGILSENTVKAIEKLGFGVDQNTTEFGKIKYVIRWYNCTKGAAGRYFKDFIEYQEIVSENIQVKVYDNLSKGYLIYNKFHLSLETYQQIESMGFGVECKEFEYGINSYIIKWYDSTEGLANECRKDFETDQQVICEEIFSEISSSINVGFYIYEDTYLLPKIQKYFIDMGYDVQEHKTIDGRFSYKISWT